MSVAARFKAKCEGCGKVLRDSSEEFLQDCADAHEEECDQLEAGDEVAVGEVGRDD